eukprot:12051461-Alexandrium_andersonii.AAC.1
MKESGRCRRPLPDFGKKAVGALRRYGFRPKDGTPMPAADAPGHPGGGRDQQSDHQHHGGGLGLACDAPG